MSPAEFLAMHGLEPGRVSRPPQSTKAPAPERVPFDQAPVKAWAPLPGFGPFIKPDLRRFYLEERGPMYERKRAAAYNPGYGNHALHAMQRARKRLYELRETFPDAIEDPVKLAKFARAQRLEGAKLAAALPGWAKAWIKAHTFPATRVFVPNQPPVFPAWTYR